MALDGIFLHLLSNQLKERFVGTRVERIHQPTREELVFALRGRNGGSRLLLSCRADSPRIHQTNHAPENPQNPPMLCMLLRKRLMGARLADIRQPDLERILCLDFNATNELGDPISLTVVIEIMARHSNIILLDQEGTVVDAVKRVDAATSSVRQVLPGLPYVLPPGQGKQSLLTAKPEELVFSLRSFPRVALSKGLQNTLQGVSPIVCRELASRSCFGDDPVVEELAPIHFDRLKEQLETVIGLLREDDAVTADAMTLPQHERENIPHPLQGTLVEDQTGKPKDFSFFDITQYGDAVNRRCFTDFSELLDAFFSERVQMDRARSRSQDLLKLLGHLCERTARRVNAQREELRQCDNKEQLRICGDLLNANLHRLERGPAFYDLENFYEDNALVRIPVNPALPPQKNAQKYYKDYRKAHTAAKVLGGLIAQGEEELVYLETVTDALGRADSDREVSEIREELTAQGYVKRKSAPARKKAALLPPREYRSSDGFLILVGRNNRQNDQLTTKKAAKTDLWFHVKDMPGSHVILVSDGEQPSLSAMEQAAQLAAYHSKGRQSSTVAVDYTQVRYVKKPAGSKPGMVVYDHHQTVMVRPEDGKKYEER